MSDDDLIEVNFSADMDTEESNTPTEISITGTIIVSAGMHKYVEYEIVCKDYSGTFKSTRRYKDFCILRSLLKQYWPGCCIPQIPPKKAFGNMTPIFIERRRRLLGLFLEKISAYSYIYNCDILQIFLKVEKSFISVINLSKPPSLQHISCALRTNFPDYEMYNLTGDEELFMNSHKLIFAQALENIEIFKKQLKKSLKFYGEFSRNYVYLMRHFDKISGLYNPFEAPYRNENANPHQCIYDWITAEVLDIKAILESISDLDSIDKDIEKLTKKLNELKPGLDRLNSGRKSIGQIFSRKTIDELTRSTDTRINEIKNDIYSLNVIKKIATVKVVYRDIEGIVKGSLCKFEGMLRMFAHSLIQEYSVYKAHAESINFDSKSF